MHLQFLFKGKGKNLFDKFEGVALFFFYLESGLEEKSGLRSRIKEGALQW